MVLRRFPTLKAPDETAGAGGLRVTVAVRTSGGVGGMGPRAGVGGPFARLASVATVCVLTGTLGSAIALVSSTATTVRAGANQYTNNGDNAARRMVPGRAQPLAYQHHERRLRPALLDAAHGRRYGQPLVDQGTLIVTTEADWIYGLDPTTGTIRWQHQVGTAFNEGSQEGCGDLTLSGITATPVIDPTTGIVYFTDKQYVSGDSGPSQYWLHAISPQTGAEESNFPVLYQGPADNDPTQSFNAYYQDQRPGLLLLGGVVYAAFGSTCDYGTYEGWVIGVSTNGTITTRWSDEAGQGQTAQGGIWQSGSGITSDGARTMIVVFTSNGQPHRLRQRATTHPRRSARAWSGSTCSPTDSSNRSTSSPPTNAAQLSTIDADFGSGGPVELPPGTFSTSKYPELSPPSARRATCTSSTPTTSAGTDRERTVATRTSPGSARSVGSGGRPGVAGRRRLRLRRDRLPQGGGPGVLKTLAWSTDASGNPTLSQVGTSSDAFGYGSRAPTVTSDSATSGSATLWTVWSSSDAPRGVGWRKRVQASRLSAHAGQRHHAGDLVGTDQPAPRNPHAVLRRRTGLRREC